MVEGHVSAVIKGHPGIGVAALSKLVERALAALLVDGMRHGDSDKDHVVGHALTISINDAEGVTYDLHPLSQEEMEYDDVQQVGRNYFDWLA